MSELVVLAFKTQTGAQEMATEIQKLQKQQLITLEDAAIVVRKEDGKAKIKQATSLVGAGALGGAFWGMLIGLLFAMPWLGFAVGAITGAIAGKATDIGINDDFIKEVSNTVEPGHSALFLLVAQATTDKVMEALKGFDATVLKTSLSKEQDERLREFFSAQESEVEEG